MPDSGEFTSHSGTFGTTATFAAIRFVMAPAAQRARPPHAGAAMATRREGEADPLARHRSRVC